MYMSRIQIQRILGLLWFFDGIFQLKPAMFTDQFLNQVILPMAQSQPTWIAQSVLYAARVMQPHIALWNAFFALIQIVIGLALIANFRVKLTLWVSFFWAAAVWWIGEGLGQLLTGSALLLTGAPGSVLLYGLIGYIVYPRANQTLGFSQHGQRVARYALALLWLIGAILQFQPVYLHTAELSQTIQFPALAAIVATHGLLFSFLLGLLQGLLAVLFLFEKRPSLFLILLSIALSTLFWWVGQSFGQVFAPTATDFNSGVLMVLLTLCVPSAPPKMLAPHRILHF